MINKILNLNIGYKRSILKHFLNREIVSKDDLRIKALNGKEKEKIQNIKSFMYKEIKKKIHISQE